MFLALVISSDKRKLSTVENQSKKKCGTSFYIIIKFYLHWSVLNLKLTKIIAHSLVWSQLNWNHVLLISFGTCVNFGVKKT